MHFAVERVPNWEEASGPQGSPKDCPLSGERPTTVADGEVSEPKDRCPLDDRPEGSNTQQAASCSAGGPPQPQALKPLLQELYMLLRGQQTHDEACLQRGQDVEQTHEQRREVVHKCRSLLKQLVGLMRLHPHLLFDLSDPHEETSTVTDIVRASFRIATGVTAVYQPCPFEALAVALEYGLEALHGDGRFARASMGRLVHSVKAQRVSQPNQTLKQLVELLRLHHERRPQQELQHPLQQRTPGRTLMLLQQQSWLIVDACECLEEVSTSIALNGWEARGLVRLLLRLLSPDELLAIQQRQELFVRRLHNEERELKQQLLELQNTLLVMQTNAGSALGNIAASWPAAGAGLYAALTPIRASQYLLHQAAKHLVSVYVSRGPHQLHPSADQETLLAARRVSIAARLRRALHRYFPDCSNCELPSSQTAGAVRRLSARMVADVTVLRVDVQQQQSLLLLSSRDKRRQCVIQVLWCLAADVGAIWSCRPPQQRGQSTASLIAAACPGLTPTLLKVMEVALAGAARSKQQQLLQATKHRGPVASTAQRMDATGADSLAPCLQILKTLVLRLFVGDVWLKELTGPLKMPLVDIMRKILRNKTHQKTGILEEALRVTSYLAKLPTQFAHPVLSLLPELASIFRTSRSSKLRQEAAGVVTALVRGGDAAEVLKVVLAATPSIIATYVNAIDTRKEDYLMIGTALEFLCACVLHEPLTHAAICANDGFAKIKSAESLLGFEGQVRWILRKLLCSAISETAFNASKTTALVV